MIDPDFTAERQRIVSWYNDSRWTAYCGYCGVRLGICNCGTTTAKDEQPAAPVVEPLTRSEWDICPVCRLATLYCKGH